MKLLVCSMMLAMACIAAAPAQHTTYRNLVFEGGGIRGVAYAGAVKSLEENGMLAQIERVAGTSSGALNALMLALGYQAEDIERLAMDMQIQQFNDGKWFFIGGAMRLRNRFGWYRGAKLSQFLEEVIVEKTGNPNLTFVELHALAGQNGFRDLYITGTSLNRQQSLIFCHEHYPNMTIRDAVRISMAIPLYFEPLTIDRNGRPVEPTDTATAVDIAVDGGITNNFPLHLFDHPSYADTLAVANGGQRYNPETIGIRLDSEAQINLDRGSGGLAPTSVTTVKEFVGAFYTLVIESLNRQSLFQEDWQRTISINTLDINPRVTRLSKNNKERLIASGQKGVADFLEDFR